MINQDVKIIRPMPVVLTAKDLQEGALFILAEDLDTNDDSLLNGVRCAVCHFNEEDYDLKTVFPFNPVKGRLDTSDNLAYVKHDTPVYLVEIVASELKIVT